MNEELLLNEKLLMNLAHIEPQSEIYGPSNRFVIWVQGCSLHCKGCWNQEMWSFREKKQKSLKDLLSMIQQEKNQANQEGNSLEGVTILGGEPLDQYKEVFALVKAVQQNLHLSVMLFTGYEFAEIEQHQQQEILKYCDIVITGRYLEQERNIHLQWRGSNNQQVHFLSDRYSLRNVKERNYCEILIDEEGRVTLLGFPIPELREQIEDL